MLEKVIERKVVNYAKKKNFRADKYTSSANKGVPDRLFISPKGCIFFIEFKRKGEVPTKLQTYVFNDILARGVSLYIIDDYEVGKLLIDKMNFIYG